MPAHLFIHCVMKKTTLYLSPTHILNRLCHHHKIKVTYKSYKNVHLSHRKESLHCFQHYNEIYFVAHPRRDWVSISEWRYKRAKNWLKIYVTHPIELGTWDKDLQRTWKWISKHEIQPNQLFKSFLNLKALPTLVFGL